MSKKRGLRSLEQWNIDARLGIVVEPEQSKHCAPNTGIGCPKCGAHLTDLSGHVVLQVVKKHPLILEEKQIVYCGVCGFGGCREIAKNRINKRWVNGNGGKRRNFKSGTE